jgi:chromosome partitioning protein
MIVTVCNGKGGAGKTTVAVLTAVALSRSGHSVAVKDVDKQGTATRWLERIGERELLGGSESAEFCIVDTPPDLDSPALHAALESSALALLVSSPSPADLWTSQRTAQVIRQSLPAGQPARIVFNQLQPRTILSRNCESLAHHIGLATVRNGLRRRQCYQHAALLGWRALSRDAKTEIQRMVDDIKGLLTKP